MFHRNKFFGVCRERDNQMVSFFTIDRFEKNLGFIQIFIRHA